MASSVVLLANFSAPSIASVPELTKYVVSKGQVVTKVACNIQPHIHAVNPLHTNIYLVDPNSLIDSIGDDLG
jgi:hypothetical protein